MSNSEEPLISRKEAVLEVRKACYHFADLYFHFAKVLIEELGHDKGKELIEKAVKSRANERGHKLAARAIQENIPRKTANFGKVTDIPFLGWDEALGNRKCPYAAAWLDRYEANPWFKEIAPFYCDTNDPLVSELFTGDTSHRITKNVLWGDAYCDRVNFPIAAKEPPKKG